MKLNFISPLRAKGGFYALLANIICVVIVAAICAGAYFGWKQYQYMQSGPYAFEKIKKALQPPDTGALASLVDFNSLSQDLATATKQSFPFFMAGADQERKIKNLYQTGLLNRFLTKEEPLSRGKEESEEDMLKKPMRIFPDDFLTQLASSIHYQSMDDNHGIITAKISNPYLGHDFTIALNMDKDANGWRVRHVVNASEFVAQVRKAMIDRYGKFRNLYVAKNESTLKRMNSQMPIQSCTAHAGLLSDHKTMLMVVRILARNTGSRQVNNFNADTVITNRAGQVILRRYLNTAMPVGPGEDFDHSWTFDMDASTPLARTLLAAGPLQCKASWQTLSLSSAEVLHIVDLPYDNRNCETPGHNHPQGFCLLPVFKQ